MAGGNPITFGRPLSCAPNIEMFIEAKIILAPAYIPWHASGLPDGTGRF
jgi:hypothetical protein